MSRELSKGYHLINHYKLKARTQHQADHDLVFDPPETLVYYLRHFHLLECQRHFLQH